MTRILTKLLFTLMIIKKEAPVGYREKQIEGDIGTIIIDIFLTVLEQYIPRPFLILQKRN